MAYQATNNSTMSNVKSSSQYITVSRPNGMGNNVVYVGCKCDKNSKEYFRHAVKNNKFCMDILFAELDKEEAKHPDGMLKKRSDIGPGYYETPKISIIRRIVCNVADNEIALQEKDMLRRERENNRNQEEQQETQNKNKRQKTTNKVSIEFTMSEPAAFNPGKVTVKTAGVKRTIYQQKNN
jgi:hypothetical protein